MLGREIQFIRLGVELGREPAKLFLGEQIEALVACLAASGRNSTEVTRRHWPAYYEARPTPQAQRELGQLSSVGNLTIVEKSSENQSAEVRARLGGSQDFAGRRLVLLRTFVCDWPRSNV